MTVLTDSLAASGYVLFGKFQTTIQGFRQFNRDFITRSTYVGRSRWAGDGGRHCETFHPKEPASLAPNATEQTLSQESYE